MTDYKALYEQSQKDIDELKSNVFNADSRCNQFRVKVGYSYIHDILEGVFDMDLDGYDEDEYTEWAEKWKCIDFHKDFLFEECARVISNCINIKGVDQEYICEEIGNEVIDKFKDNEWIHQPYSSNVIADLIDDSKEQEEEDADVEHIARIIERTRIANEGLRWDNQDPGEVLEE